MEQLKDFLRPFFPQWIINYFYHLPLAFLANLFYDFPTRGVKVIGVTGTDGKSTTVNIIYQILKAAGFRVSMVSTINAVIGGKTYDTGFHVTSPNPFMVQRFARQAADHGDQYLVLEVTSHALDQFRFWGVKFDVGAITNITHEHLDYHQTLENYKKTKLKLIKGSKYAIINWVIRGIGDVGAVRKKIITFGLEKGDFNQKDLRLKLKIPGDYNLENALCALACTSVLGVDQNIARKSIEGFQGIPGRMEEVKNSRRIKIIIDFAHTPNGLEQALKTLRSKGRPGRLIAVFGSAGKRDVGKRALMGEVVARGADYLVVTAEDPRGELKKICEQIAGGAQKVGAILDKNLFIIEDRGKALDFAINVLAKKGDTVGIFGKGHEISMNMDGKTEIPWSDKEAVKKALREVI